MRVDMAHRILGRAGTGSRRELTAPNHFDIQTICAILDFDLEERRTNMQLVFSGSAGSCACDWRYYALLRDNIQHFVEQGVPSKRFVALHDTINVRRTGTGPRFAPTLLGAEPSGSDHGRRTLWLFSVAALAASVFAAGCSASLPPPRAAPNPEGMDPPSAEQRREEQRPDLVAPPPAYGNKVVLAAAQ
jgi:hypothetical protein